MAGVNRPSCTNKERHTQLKRRITSPTIRSILRERYKQRVHNDRHSILNKLRNWKDDDLRNTLTAIIQQEWMDVKKSCQRHYENNSTEDYFDCELLIKEELDQELLREEEDWLLAEYESLLASEEDLDKHVNILCPLCQNGHLQLSNNKIECSACAVLLPASKSLLDLQKDIHQNILTHGATCEDKLLYVVLPQYQQLNQANLCILCSQCTFANCLL